ncbi:MAG: hypothetical protein K0U93_13055, partial [Gammaproteobacteria bacterium]|nr:hypothetical protein [Gammaproteobacteria bacterium]
MSNSGRVYPHPLSPERYFDAETTVMFLNEIALAADANRVVLRMFRQVSVLAVLMWFASSSVSAVAADSFDDSAQRAFQLRDRGALEQIIARVDDARASKHFHAAHAAELSRDYGKAAKLYAKYLATREDKVYREEARLKAATIRGALKRGDTVGLGIFLSAL